MPLVKYCDVNKYDISRYIKEKPTSSELSGVIENIWKPDNTFDFPVTMEGNGKKKRRKRFCKELAQ